METNDNTIKEKLIEQQDLVSFYAVSSYNKSVGVLQEYSSKPRILYSDLKRYLIQDIELLKKFSTDNLIKILSSGVSGQEEQKQELVNLIMQRLEQEEFFCEDIDDSFFMKPTHLVNIIFHELGKENVEKIKQRTIERLQMTKGTAVENIAERIGTVNDAANFLRYFEQGVFSPDKIEMLENMIKQDEKALEYCNFGIFQDDIFNMGTKFVKYISKFPKLSAQLVILQKQNPQLLSVISDKVQGYENLPDNYDELEILITYFTRKCYDIKLEKIDEKTIEDLTNCAILNAKAQNDQAIINIEYTQDYAEKLKEEYKKRYQVAQDIETKKNIYFNKKFSISISEARKLIEEYGSDLDNLAGIDEADKKLFQGIKEILNIDEEINLDELYNKTNIRYDASEILTLKHRVAKECALSYSKTMQQTDDSIKELLNSNEEELVDSIEFEGKQIKQIKLKGKFDLLVHSSDTGFIQESMLNEERDFVKSWKEGKDKSNHIISSCFINQDFLGCAPVNENGVMYGFTTVTPENIRLMGVTDINTYSRDFAYDSKEKRYMSAKTMPYNSRRVYNEFGLERENVIPDYVVLFDDMNEQVKENTCRAALQFGIPLLFVDKREIEQEQIKNLQSLIEDFSKKGNIEILKQLLNTYETNVAGWLLNRDEKEDDETHTMSIDNSRFKKDFSDIWNTIYDMVSKKIDIKVKDSNSEKSIEELKNIVEVVLEEMELYAGTEETKPITKTSISFNAKEIIQKVNEGFDNLGMSQFKVDLEHIPTAEQYKINMRGIMQNALCGENRVTNEDIKTAENARNLKNIKGRTKDE